VLFCGDDKNVREVVEQLRAEQPRSASSISARRRRMTSISRITASMTAGPVRGVHQKQPVGLFHLRIPGEFNARNSLAAIGPRALLGIPLEKIRASLESFTHLAALRDQGALPRRAHCLDYAHHPTAVRLTIEAARQFYPGRRIVPSSSRTSITAPAALCPFLKASIWPTRSPV
jgi:UDP-N-acetylmuramate-alanine ligase